MRVWLGLVLLLAGTAVAALHFQRPWEPPAIEQIILVQDSDRRSNNGSAVRGAGGFASQLLSRSNGEGGDLTLAAQWERRTDVVGSIHGSSDNASNKPLSGAELARALQSELKRVGCYKGAIDGDWGPLSRRALSNFTSRMSNSPATEEPDDGLLRIVQVYSGQACGSSCGAGETLDEAGRCMPSTILAGGSAAPSLERPEPLPGRMAIGGPSEGIGTYVALTREAESSTDQSSQQPRVTRRPRTVEQSTPQRRTAPERKRSNWAQTFFERIERR